MIEIEFKNISKIYGHDRGQVKAVNNVSFQVDKGEFCAIMGPSGSGKTTLLCIAGLLLTPDLGLIKLFGQPIDYKSSDKLAKLRASKLGFVFQNFNLLPYLSALDNVKIAIDISKKSGDSIINPKAILEKVGLGNRINHLPGELSGGEQQRVSIARALVNNPDLILADEPTGNLDSKNGKEVIDLISNLSEELGKTVIIVTHDQDIAKKADKNFHIVDGILK